jgi:hypothetical protein
VLEPVAGFLVRPHRLQPHRQRYRTGRGAAGDSAECHDAKRTGNTATNDHGHDAARRHAAGIIDGHAAADLELGASGWRAGLSGISTLNAHG